MTELHWLTLTDAAEEIRSRRLSPVELLEALLARIDGVGRKLDAFVFLDREAALAAARAAEAEIAGGCYRGPLHGIAVGIKDCIDVAGMPTTCHSKVLANNVAGIDAEVVRLLRQAGATIVGKLAMHEFAIDGPDFDLPFPPARNPWNHNHHPGGSSSGGGAAVAGGLLTAAIGTDAGGSIRHPASACGLVGLKPTYDLIPRRGTTPLTYTLEHLGPMTRTVKDSALMLDVLTKVNSETCSYASELGKNLNGLRIGFVRHFHETDMPADEETATALEEVARILAVEGASVGDVTLPSLMDFSVVNRTILLAEAWSAMGPEVRRRPADFGRLSRRRLLSGAFITASDYINAQRQRSILIAAVDTVFEEVDILLVASSMCPASRIDDPAELARTYPRQARGPFNVTGHPALAMMAGKSSAGMPLSVQFVGRYGQEKTLLQVAFAYERVTQWHRLRPTDTP